MEVSDLGDKFENALTSTLAYSTTTNNASTILRLKDGETQILAGLIRAYANNSTKQKVLPLGDIPLLGRLFGIKVDDWQNRANRPGDHAPYHPQQPGAGSGLAGALVGNAGQYQVGDSNLKMAGTAGVLSQNLTAAACTPPAAPAGTPAPPTVVKTPPAVVAAAAPAVEPAAG